MKWHRNNVTLFFDYDGTIHESLGIYAPAFRLAQKHLIRLGLAPDTPYSDQEISRWLGCSTKEMWDSFLPDLPDGYKKQAGNLIGDEMLRLTRQGGAVLYPGAPDGLSVLKNSGFHLVFLSNCKHSYMEAHRDVFHLDRYFEAFYCIEDFPVITKTQLYEKVEKNHPGAHVIIGDRKHDMEIAKTFHLPSVGCFYGYGTEEELHMASCTIQAIDELIPLFAVTGSFRQNFRKDL